MKELDYIYTILMIGMTVVIALIFWAILDVLIYIEAL